MGMRFLKSGASATEAVEAALRVLEDKEITNAGYGSNLSMDGTVECDATIVDHLGRSGACGAVPSESIVHFPEEFFQADFEQMFVIPFVWPSSSSIRATSL